MCGIAGVRSRGTQAVAWETVERMTEVLSHRGPDETGYWVRRPLGLGFRRLAIIDLGHGHQPMLNEDRSVVAVVNGEIYNHRELRRELAALGHQFATASDSEVVVHLYEESGIEGITRLRGMFALALYDQKDDSLYLARDYFGIKPLYWAATANWFLFASEVKSLLASGLIQPQWDPQAVWDYLTFQYVPDPRTLFRGVYKLPAAHYLRYQGGQWSVHRYWEPGFEPQPEKPLEYFLEGVEQALWDSVQSHLEADVPVGALLSGGVDSAAVVAMMRSQRPVKTFSIGFEGAQGAHNELEAARQTARWLETEHHEVVVGPDQFWQAAAAITYHHDDPLADASGWALYFLAELARREVTVVLSGEGADELFGGYRIYHEPYSLRAFEYLPESVRQGLGRLARHLPPGMKGRSFLERGSLPLSRRFLGNAHIFSDDFKRQWLDHPPWADLPPSWSVTDPLYAETERRGWDAVTSMQWIDLNTWLPGDILPKADRMTMAHSLELRVPFLDREVFRWAAAIPTAYRIQGPTTKWLLRQALRRWLPESVRERPKLGFPVPLRAWLQGPLYAPARQLIRESPLGEVLNLPAIEAMLEAHRLGQANHARKLWTILALLHWHRVFVEGAMPTPTRQSGRYQPACPVVWRQ